MRRFVVFGCSIAAGYGLDSKEEGWASILSKRANLELVNNGIPGASNKLICSKIEQFKFENVGIENRKISWIPKDNITTGTYFINVRTKNITRTQKILFIK